MRKKFFKYKEQFSIMNNSFSLFNWLILYISQTISFSIYLLLLLLYFIILLLLYILLFFIIVYFYYFYFYFFHR